MSDEYNPDYSNDSTNQQPDSSVTDGGQSFEPGQSQQNDNPYWIQRHNQKISAKDENEYRSWAQKGYDYSQNQAALNQERETHKNAIELWNYLQANPEKAQRVYESLTAKQQAAVRQEAREQGQQTPDFNQVVAPIADRLDKIETENIRVKLESELQQALRTHKLDHTDVDLRNDIIRAKLNDPNLTFDQCAQHYADRLARYQKAWQAGLKDQARNVQQNRTPTSTGGQATTGGSPPKLEFGSPEMMRAALTTLRGDN